MKKAKVARRKWASKAMMAVITTSMLAAISPAYAQYGAVPTQHRPLDCDAVRDARILAADGTYLGLLTDQQHRESVMNKNGPYGSATAANSLWNPSSPYGSASSRKSPMNGHNGLPAQLVKNGQVVGKVMRGSLRRWMEDPAKLVQRCYGHRP